MELEYSYKVGGYLFKLNEGMYECRGEVCYDDEHDETPEPGLWIAANKLADRLGERWQAQHSEKGWCEVQKWDKDSVLGSYDKNGDAE